jgi:hypothetical protein
LAETTGRTYKSVAKVPLSTFIHLPKKDEDGKLLESELPATRTTSVKYEIVCEVAIKQSTLHTANIFIPMKDLVFLDKTLQLTKEALDDILKKTSFSRCPRCHGLVPVRDPKLPVTCVGCETDWEVKLDYKAPEIPTLVERKRYTSEEYLATMTHELEERARVWRKTVGNYRFQARLNREAYFEKDREIQASLEA